MSNKKIIEEFDKEVGYDETSLRDMRIISFIEKKEKEVREETINNFIEYIWQSFWKVDRDKNEITIPLSILEQAKENINKLYDK